MFAYTWTIKFGELMEVSFIPDLTEVLGAYLGIQEEGREARLLFTGCELEEALKSKPGSCYGPFHTTQFLLSAVVRFLRWPFPEWIAVIIRNVFLLNQNHRSSPGQGRGEYQHGQARQHGRCWVETGYVTHPWWRWMQVDVACNWTLNNKLF